VNSTSMYLYPGSTTHTTSVGVHALVQSPVGGTTNDLLTKADSLTNIPSARIDDMAKIPPARIDGMTTGVTVEELRRSAQVFSEL